MKKYLILLVMLFVSNVYSQDYYKVSDMIKDSIFSRMGSGTMTSALSSYETVSAFNTAIANYSTTTQMNTALSSYPTTSSLNSTLTGYFLLSGKNTVADSTIFSDNIFTTNIYPTATNTNSIGVSSKQYTTLYTQLAPYVNNIQTFGFSAIGSPTDLSGSILLIATLISKMHFVPMTLNGVTLNYMTFTP